MAIAVITSFLQQCDSNGVPLNAGTIDVYAAGTTTPLSLWSAGDLTGAAANPITLDASGRHAITYIATASYKILVKNSAGTTIYTRDNIDPGVAIGSGALPVANGGTGASTAGGARTNLGAAAESTVTALSADVLTLQGYHVGTTAMPVASGTTAQRPGSPADYQLRGNTTLGSPEMYLGGTYHKVSIGPPIAGGFKGLIITNNSGTPNTQIDVDATAVTVETTDGVAIRLNNIDLTINCAGTGANGLDAGALANSTWYNVWIIFNPATGTTAGLISSSATSPTMPSGYTFKARFGAVITDGTAIFRRTRQLGRRTQYVVTASTILPLMDNASKGTYSNTSPTLLAVSVSPYVPPTATVIWIAATPLLGGAAAAGVIVAPTVDWGGTNRGPQGSSNQVYPFYNGAITSGGAFPIVLETTSIAWASNNNGGAIACYGWEDNI